MTFTKQIAELTHRSKQESWSYPKLFEVLKQAGVQRYEVQVKDRHTTYYRTNETYFEPQPESQGDLEIAETFNTSRVQAAIKRNQDKITDYPQFLQEIAEAGVSSYSVDMATRALTYQGEAGEQYVERVPKVTA